MPPPTAQVTTGELIGSGYEPYILNSHVERFYSHSNFSNWGYWTPGTTDTKKACENLVEVLLAFLPEKSGSILDVACGQGGTTHYLLRYFAPEDVCGIDMSPAQLERARALSPEARFTTMDATDLEFPNASLDVIIAVEAAFHFDTRERFLSEVRRVLVPGGRLVVSDILFTLACHLLSPAVPSQNFVAGPAEYRDLLTNHGFGAVEVIDATEQCWHPWKEQYDRYLFGEIRRGGLRPDEIKRLLARRQWRVASVRHYLLASGVRL